MRGLLVLSCLISFCLVGCGGDGFEKPVPVSGKVVLNSKPVDGAMVTFHSKSGGRAASGNTDKEGNFKLTSVNTDDGAAPGEYAITVVKQETKDGGSSSVDISKGYGEDYGKMMGAAASGNMSKVMKDLVPAKYASAADSGLVRTVVKGDQNNFTIDLK